MSAAHRRVAPAWLASCIVNAGMSVDDGDGRTRADEEIDHVDTALRHLPPVAVPITDDQPNGVALTLTIDAATLLKLETDHPSPLTADVRARLFDMLRSWRETMEREMGQGRLMPLWKPRHYWRVDENVMIVAFAYAYRRAG